MANSSSSPQADWTSRNAQLNQLKGSILNLGLAIHQSEQNNDLTDMISQMNFALSKLRNHLEENDRLDQRERNVMKLMKLNEEVTLSSEYSNDCNKYKEEKKVFPAGTFIQCGSDGSVYLDDDGDGFLYFPPGKLREVEVQIDSPDVDWDKVVWQG